MNLHGFTETAREISISNNNASVGVMKSIFINNPHDRIVKNMLFNELVESEAAVLEQEIKLNESKNQMLERMKSLLKKYSKSKIKTNIDVLSKYIDKAMDRRSENDDQLEEMYAELKLLTDGTNLTYNNDLDDDGHDASPPPPPPPPNNVLSLPTDRNSLPTSLSLPSVPTYEPDEDEKKRKTLDDHKIFLH